MSFKKKCHMERHIGHLTLKKKLYILKIYLHGSMRRIFNIVKVCVIYYSNKIQLISITVTFKSFLILFASHSQCKIRINHYL